MHKEKNESCKWAVAKFLFIWMHSSLFEHSMTQLFRKRASSIGWTDERDQQKRYLLPSRLPGNRCVKWHYWLMSVIFFITIRMGYGIPIDFFKNIIHWFFCLLNFVILIGLLDWTIYLPNNLFAFHSLSLSLYILVMESFIKAHQIIKLTLDEIKCVHFER